MPTTPTPLTAQQIQRAETAARIGATTQQAAAVAAVPASALNTHAQQAGHKNWEEYARHLRTLQATAQTTARIQATQAQRPPA